VVWTLIREWSQKQTLRAMLKDPRATRGFRSTGQLEKAIGADRFTTERLLLAVGAEVIANTVTSPPAGGGVSARFSAASAFARQSPALSQRSISWVSGSHPLGLLSSTASSSSKNQPAR